MSQRDIERYSYAFHEAGHVFVANRLAVPYVDARIVETGGFGGAFHVDHEAINRRLAENKGNLNVVHETLCKLIYVLKGGETVDREIARVPNLWSRLALQAMRRRWRK